MAPFFDFRGRTTRYTTAEADARSILADRPIDGVKPFSLRSGEVGCCFRSCPSVCLSVCPQKSKSRVVPYSITNVWFGADPGFLAVNPRVIQS